jgi:hypothetical protein
MTRVVAEMTNQIKVGAEPLTMSVISESIVHLGKTYTPVMAHLKTLTEYRKELYKLELRDVTGGLSKSDAANSSAIKKAFLQAKPGVTFFPDLAEEVIKEDTSSEGPALREEVLKKLKVADNKPKTVKAQVSFKSILIEGIQTLGGTAATFTDIAGKLDDNEVVMENKKKSFFQKLKKLLQQVLNKEPEPVIYDVEYMDPVKAVNVQERINFSAFRGDLDRKIRTLAPMAARGGAASKLEAMQEEQLIGFLERNVREIQSMHKTLTALDEFFKSGVDKEDRDKIKGIKPELGTIKNAILRANSKRHEYSAQKEEEEQLKRLGVNSLT